MNALLRVLRNLKAIMLPLAGILILNSSALAHICGPMYIYMLKNSTRVYSIKADVDESKPSKYKATSVSNPSVATVLPGVDVEFSSLEKGDFLIRSGDQTGASIIMMTWSYEPNSAGGPCEVHVHVFDTQAALEQAKQNASFYRYSGYGVDPIDTYTGDFYMSEAPDLKLGGPMPLFFQRSYNSGFKRQDFVTGRMGRNWTHNYDQILYRAGDIIYITHLRGTVVEFELVEGNWQLRGPISQPFQLIEQGGGYVLMNGTNQRRYFFDENGTLTSVRDRNNNTHTLTTNGRWPTEISDGLGRSLTLTYSGFHKIASVSDGTRTIQFQNFFEDLESVQDARNNLTTYNYLTADGMLYSTTLPRGNTPLSRAYSDNSATVEDDAYGNRTTLDFNGPETVITDPLQDVRKHVHSPDGELTRIIDPLDQATVLGYNEDERRSSITNRLGDTTSWTIHTPTGQMATITDPAGNTTEFRYTAQVQDGFTYYDLTEIIHADGTVTAYEYDTRGNLLRLITPANDVWEHAYNSRGQILTATNPEGGTTTYTYDSTGSVASIEDSAGNVTQLFYDNLFRPIRIEYADGTERSYTYDANNNTLTVTVENNNTWTYTYDENNNLETAMDPLGQAAVFTYDLMDRLVLVEDREGNTLDFSYDERGRLAATANGIPEQSTFEYDHNDLHSVITGNDNNVQRFERDAEGRITSAKDPMGNEWTFERDILGRTTRQISPNGAERTFEYDLKGQLRSIQGEDGETWSQVLDANGRITSIILDNGLRAHYTYNGLGIADSITDPNGNVWGRDFTAAGRRQTMTDPLGRSVDYSYDTRNRLSTVTSAQGTLTFAYSSVGNLLARTYSDGTSMTYSYDANGRLTATDGITFDYDKNGRLTGSNGFIMTYDVAGRLMTVDYGQDKVVTYTYNPAGLVSEVTDWVGGVTRLEYDAAGALISISRPNELKTSLGYDANASLISREVTDLGAGGTPTVSSIELTRSLGGRILSSERDLPGSGVLAPMESFFSFDAAHQITGTGYAYDAGGRRLEDPDRSYTWNLASLLESFTDSSGTTDCMYDALGNRTQIETGDITRGYQINYVFGYPSVCTITNGSSPITHYIYLPSGVLLHSIQDSGSERHFYHYDEMGNTIYLSDDSGNVTDTYTLTPFGRLIGQSGSTENPFIYGGMFGAMYEGGDLYYMRARYYDATTGRFISKDPIESMDPQALNRYQYAYNNPKLYADPGGKQVSFGGYGRFGAAYREGQFVNSSSSSAESRLVSRFRLNIDGKAVTDGGVEFSARVRLRDDDRAGDPRDSSTDGSSFGASNFAVSAGGFRVDVGNVSDVIDSGDIVDYYGYGVGLTSFSEFKFLPPVPETNRLAVSYTAGDFTVSAGYSSSPPNQERRALNFSYTFGGWTAALGLSDSDPTSHLGEVDSKATGISLAYDISAATEIRFVYSEAQGSSIDETTSIGFRHSLGGGVTIRGGIDQSTFSDTIADLGVSFSF